MKISHQLLETLVCPLTRTQLIYNSETQELISHVSGLAYPIRSGIPIMLPNEARIDNKERVALICPELIEEK
jgi:uncharacterized protein YbaR (Trm112 family)